jgi:hypothetical protein
LRGCPASRRASCRATGSWRRWSTARGRCPDQDRVAVFCGTQIACKARALPGTLRIGCASRHGRRSRTCTVS